MDDIKHDPDPLLTSMMNLMWRYDKDPSADALVNVLNEAAAEIERLRAEQSNWQRTVSHLVALAAERGAEIERLKAAAPSQTPPANQQ